jgi:hypothetical protein
VDSETGELYEGLPVDVSGTEPYDYADYKRATLAATREKRQVLAELEKAIEEKAEAEGEYRRLKAKAMRDAREKYGATMAADMAKGEDPLVVEALKRRERAVDMVKVLQERARLCSEDRASLHRLGEWSREADPDGWRNAGGRA